MGKAGDGVCSLYRTAKPQKKSSLAFGCSRKTASIERESFGVVRHAVCLWSSPVGKGRAGSQRFRRIGVVVSAIGPKATEEPF